MSRPVDSQQRAARPPGAALDPVAPGAEQPGAPRQDAALGRQQLDEELSKRFIALDPQGYFLIRIDTVRQELVVEHYGNTIDARGLATDPETGEVIACRGSGPRTPQATYRGRTAKQVGIALTEGEGPHPISCLDHALYLGRELQKAEACLEQGLTYVQD